MSVAQIGPVYVPQSAQPPEVIPAIPGAPAALQRSAYAGFWLRAAAYFIDSILISPVLGLAMSFNPDFFFKWPKSSAESLIVLPQPTRYAFVLFVFGAAIIYSLFDSSGWQATPGKRTLRLYVTDMNGQRLSFTRAAGRNVMKMISAVAFPFFFLLAGITPQKQALHDVLAGCLVLRRAKK